LKKAALAPRKSWKWRYHLKLPFRSNFEVEHQLFAMNVTIKVRTRSKSKVHINLRQIQEHIHPRNNWGTTSNSWLGTGIFKWKWWVKL